MSFNFALILFWLMVATGVVWFADLLVFRRRRIADADIALKHFDAQAKLNETDGRAVSHDPKAVGEERARLRERLIRQPGWIEFPAGFFPVILVVFILRSFLFEPFRIPSGSMIPTLLVGDLILVNKFSYGIRLPIVNRKVIDIGNPERGDVMVFRYPLNPAEDYVKRVIGLPGDTVVYKNKQLSVNGQVVSKVPTADFYDADRVSYSKQYAEALPSARGNASHMILQNDESAGIMQQLDGFVGRQFCSYADGYTTITCKVPQGFYFMMGDNRDNSADSRFWGLVPDQNIVGRAILIWMNFGNMGRIGRFD